MRIQHRNRSHGLSSSETLRYKSNQDLYTESGSGQTSECSFSSVSTPPIARVGAFCSNYCRDLQNVLSFARLRLQNLSKMLLHFFRVCTEMVQNFCRNVFKCNEISLEFDRRAAAPRAGVATPARKMVKKMLYWMRRSRIHRSVSRISRRASRINR